MSEFVIPIASDIHSVHVDSLIPDDTEVGDRSPSKTLDLLGGLGGKTETPLSGFGKPITGDIRSVHMDAPIPDDTEVRDQSSSETPDIVGDLGRTTESPVPEFGKPITGDIHSLHICSHVRRDEDSSLLAGLDMLFVSVNHPMFGDFNSEFGDVY